MRIHLFEFHDSSFCPNFIREAIVETLGLALRWGKITQAYAPSFEEFYLEANCPSVVDLCSGSGQAVVQLIDILKTRGKVRPQIILSDLYPHIPAMKKAKRQHPRLIRFRAHPQDATQMSPQMKGKAVMMLNAFHHFNPDLAQKILQESGQLGIPIFIHESFPRNPLRLFSMLHLLSLAILVVPFTTSKNRLLKLIFILLIPIIPLFGLWDGLVSTLRIHGEDELRQMVKSNESTVSFEWVYREIPFSPLGLATVFYGIPGSKRRIQD